MKFSILKVAAIVVVIFLLLSLWLLYSMKTAATDNYSRIALRNNSLEAEAAKAYIQTKSLKSKLADVESQRDALVSKISDFEIQIQNMKTAHETAIRDMAAEIDKLKAALIQKERERELYESEKKAEVQNLKIKISKITKRNRQIYGRAAGSADASVRLEPITVTSQNKKIEGRILAINREYGFVIINVGAEDGVVPGDALFVFRKNNILGKVLVEKVDKNVCAAKILFKSLSDSVEKEDLVSN